MDAYIVYIYVTVISLCILLEALPRVCTENTAWGGGVSRDKYSMRLSRVLYLSQDTSRVLYFPHMSIGSALGGIKSS